MFKMFVPDYFIIKDNIKFSVKSYKQHISLYADEILLFILDLQAWFPRILKVFGKFRGQNQLG